MLMPSLTRTSYPSIPCFKLTSSHRLTHPARVCEQPAIPDENMLQIFWLITAGILEGLPVHGWWTLPLKHTALLTLELGLPRLPRRDRFVQDFNELLCLLASGSCHNPDVAAWTEESRCCIPSDVGEVC